jgi:hypothetical protein
MAPLSSMCQPRRCARLKHSVPLPAPPGPSTVIIGTASVNGPRPAWTAAARDPARQRIEAREGRGHVIAVEDADLRAGAQGGDGERHGDTVVVERANHATTEFPPLDDDAVLEHLVVHAEGRQPLGHAVMRSLSLTRSSSGTAQHGTPLGASGGNEQGGELVDSQGDLRLGNLDAAQVARGARAGPPRARRRPRARSTR